MRRFVSFVFAVLVAVTFGTDGGAAIATSQENPDENPELTIVVTTDGYEVPETLVSGWYYLTLDNQTQEDVVADFVMLPEGKDVEEFQGALSTSDGGSTVPEWFEQVVFAGGPSALPESTAQTLIELTPGTWTVLEVGETGGPFSNVNVTQSVKQPETPALEATVGVTFSPTAFEMPVEIPADFQVWSVANSDNRAHSFAVLQIPAAVTFDQMLALLTQGTQPEGVDMSQSVIVGGIGLLSGGRTIWTSFTLEAGFYVALDYVPQVDGRTYAEIGFLAVFEVK